MNVGVQSSARIVLRAREAPAEGNAVFMPPALAVEPSPASKGASALKISESASAWLLIGTLAWAQFPLGSNRPWSWSLLVLLISAAWLLWLPRAISAPQKLWRHARPVLVPAGILVLVLIWAALQTVPWSPASLHNGIWQILPRSVASQGAISVNPYESATEAMKLASFVLAGALTYFLSRREERARRFYLAIVAIGFFYAAYGLYLVAVGSSQLHVLTGNVSPYGAAVSGGFVSRNSFATFDSMTLVVCASLIADNSARTVSISRGLRRFLQTLVTFLIGGGAVLIVAASVMFAALLLSDSRAGVIACFAGLLLLFGLALVVSRRRGLARAGIVAGLCALSVLSLIFLLSGDTIAARFDQLVETRGSEELRPVMWGAALHAIEANPGAGSGLGTFHDVYPLYADRFVPYEVDRVHSDYLEFALGLGIPMAALWIIALAALVIRCGVGVLKRRRRQFYPLAAIGAAAVIAVHSLFDFSLQMPAVALLFAVVLGAGSAQAAPTSMPDGADA